MTDIKLLTSLIQDSALLTVNITVKIIQKNPFFNDSKKALNSIFTIRNAKNCSKVN